MNSREHKELVATGKAEAKAEKKEKEKDPEAANAEQNCAELQQNPGGLQPSVLPPKTSTAHWQAQGSGPVLSSSKTPIPPCQCQDNARIPQHNGGLPSELNKLAQYNMENSIPAPNNLNSTYWPMPQHGLEPEYCQTQLAAIARTSPGFDGHAQVNSSNTITENGMSSGYEFVDPEVFRNAIEEHDQFHGQDSLSLPQSSASGFNSSALQLHGRLPVQPQDYHVPEALQPGFGISSFNDANQQHYTIPAQTLNTPWAPQTEYTGTIEPQPFGDVNFQPWNHQPQAAARAGSPYWTGPPAGSSTSTTSSGPTGRLRPTGYFEPQHLQVGSSIDASHHDYYYQTPPPPQAAYASSTEGVYENWDPASTDYNALSQCGLVESQVASSNGVPGAVATGPAPSTTGYGDSDVPHPGLRGY